MEENQLTAGKKSPGAAETTAMQPGEPYAKEHGEGAKGEGYPVCAGGNSPAGDSPLVVTNPQGNTRGDAAFVEAARKFKY